MKAHQKRLLAKASNPRSKQFKQKARERSKANKEQDRMQMKDTAMVRAKRAELKLVFKERKLAFKRCININGQKVLRFTPDGSAGLIYHRDGNSISAMMGGAS